MRAIKFRAWNEYGNRWLRSGEYFINPEDGAVWLFDENEIDHDSLWKPAEYMGYGSDIKVMQYTGLKDKNGVEIYEGDIVEDTLKGVSKETSHILTVEFRQSAFCFKEIPNTAFLEGWHDAVVVIGNIHENPELMEVK